MVSISRWKCSGALVIPNGIRLKEYLPNGVINVVSSRELSSKGICQNPLLASILLKTVAPLPVVQMCCQLSGEGGFLSTHSL